MTHDQHELVAPRRAKKVPSVAIHKRLATSLSRASPTECPNTSFLRRSEHYRSVILSVLNQSSIGHADRAFLSSSNRFRFLANGY
jgi:hypothetical protein